MSATYEDVEKIFDKATELLGIRVSQLILATRALSQIAETYPETLHQVKAVLKEIDELGKGIS